MTTENTAVAESPALADEQPAATPPAPASDVLRLARLRVPAIVRLACRTMSISAIRKLSNGAIIEFGKPVDANLDLLINNRVVAQGITVKTGENFGLKITRVKDRAGRIRSLGA